MRERVVVTQNQTGWGLPAHWGRGLVCVEGPTRSTRCQHFYYLTHFAAMPLRVCTIFTECVRVCVYMCMCGCAYGEVEEEKRYSWYIFVLFRVLPMGMFIMIYIFIDLLISSRFSCVDVNVYLFQFSHIYSFIHLLILFIRYAFLIQMYVRLNL